METITSWVKPPKQIGGLDHLAVQAPCINIYGRLLPGITNVTDRARYYSFYPWIVWALEQAGHKFNDEFIQQFRRADCLFTLIAQRHYYLSETNYDDHAGATVGSGNMAELIANIKARQSVRLSDVSHLGDGEGTRYFKNKLGGLGQYYQGVFAELGIMDGNSSSGIKNTNQIGRVLAEVMDQGVNRGLFLKTLDDDLVTVERLDELVDFCSCRLSHSAKEHLLLTDIFFVRGLFQANDMMPRRRSLQTIIYLADDLARQGQSIDLRLFRGAIYGKTLPDGSDWILPERLHENRARWAVYQRNELLSVAIQGIFFVLLAAYENLGYRIESADQLCRWFITSQEVGLLNEALPLDDRVSDIKSAAQTWLPDIGDWTNEHHEVQLANKIEILSVSKESAQHLPEILKSALRVLVALMNRPETQNGYEDFVFNGQYFQAYPINLKSFLAHSNQTWGQLTVREWIGWLANQWGVKTHFRVALRKLRGQSQSTFRIRPTDHPLNPGLEVIAVPAAIFTMPRFYQSLRILRDLGALVKREGDWHVSDLGQELKEVIDG